MKKRVILISHEITKTGASILCLKISEALKKMGYHTILISMIKGEVTQEYINGTDELYMINSQGKQINPSDEKKCKLENYGIYNDLGPILRILGRKKLVGAIVNTVICGNTVRLLEVHNIKTVCLIHEMIASCQILNAENYVKEIAEYANYTIFPAECVKNDFETMCEIKNTNIRIIPQGYYKEVLEYTRNSEFKKNLIEKLNIPEDSKIFVGAGSINFGKGVDLLPLIAKKLETHKNYHFIWMGTSNEKNYSIWLNNQIEKMGLSEKIHFIGFIDSNEEYIKILCGCDLFLLVSREDSMPSVLMEAMAVKLPILAFKKSGGAQDLLCDDRGYLVDYMDIDNYCEMIINIEMNDSEAEIKTKKAYEYLENQLIFKDYVKKIVNLFFD